MKFARSNMLPSAEQLIFILRDVMGYRTVNDINDTITLTKGKHTVTIPYGTYWSPAQEENLREQLRPLFNSSSFPYHVNELRLTRMIRNWLA